MEQEKILDIAVRIGSVLLRFGAETYRVEDTIKRICMSYNLECEPFALPTGVFVSVEGDKGISTICKRISLRTVDLTKIARLNDLSRRIELNKPNYKEVIIELDNILNSPSYSNIVIILCYAFTSFAYALLFGGSGYDALWALLIGAFLGLIRPLFFRHSFPFIEYFVNGVTAGILSSIAANIFPNTTAYVVIIGALINLLPGVAITNGLRDLLHGDNVSGLARLGEAFMSVSVLAAGAGIGLTLWFYGGL